MQLWVFLDLQKISTTMLFYNVSKLSQLLSNFDKFLLLGNQVTISKCGI